MEKYILFLSNIPLFAGIFKQDMANLLRGAARVKNYAARDVIIAPGSVPAEFGIVLEGLAEVSDLDIFGKKAKTEIAGPGRLFAELLVCAGTQNDSLSVSAQENCTVMFINYKALLSAPKSAAGDLFLANLLKHVSLYGAELKNKIEIVSKPSTRAKISAYLLRQTKLNGGVLRFKIPHDRAAMAEYLCVNRAALSRELAALRAEGIIKYRKNNFEISDVRKLTS
ncbi:MAG: Crp/Fnr family transcriptional regulator [Elusimicrobia bacterium]|nr:Crp/Fnr family transcriptional regulator [Elusimicrobiota bacterium]